MPGGGPSWLTGWVKLNNKHVVHASGKSSSLEDDEKCHQTATTARSPATLISSKSVPRSRKTKEKAITIDESSDDEIVHNISHHLSRQILNEAAFMTEVNDIHSPELMPGEYHTAVPRSSPEGLIVTTFSEKFRPQYIEPKSSHLNRLAAIFAGEREPCQSCISLMKKLDEAFDDIEYMRIVALQQQQHHVNGAVDHHANDCACGNFLRSVSVKPSVTAANELQELVQRHKQVVEALMSERARYQETMEQEVNRRDIVCQDLSKEVAVRKHESLTLQEKLNTTRGERDELAIENFRLKAKVSSHAKQEAEYSELKRRYLDYEERGIQGAVAAIESRDKVIDDLSMKLEQALDQLELEREQQRQRRQIIFPPSPPVAAKKG